MSNFHCENLKKTLSRIFAFDVPVIDAQMPCACFEYFLVSFQDNFNHFAMAQSAHSLNEKLLFIPMFFFLTIDSSAVKFVE